MALLLLEIKTLNRISQAVRYVWLSLFRISFPVKYSLLCHVEGLDSVLRRNKPRLTEDCSAPCSQWIPERVTVRVVEPRLLLKKAALGA